VSPLCHQLKPFPFRILSTTVRGRRARKRPFPPYLLFLYSLKRRKAVQAVQPVKSATFLRGSAGQVEKRPVQTCPNPSNPRRPVESLKSTTAPRAVFQRAQAQPREVATFDLSNILPEKAVDRCSLRASVFRLRKSLRLELNRNSRPWAIGGWLGRTRRICGPGGWRSSPVGCP